MKINLLDQIIYFIFALIFVIHYTIFAFFIFLKYLFSIFFGFISLIFNALLILKLSSENHCSCICKIKK